MYRILFVCMGNICRSPAAEGLLRDRFQREAPQWLDRIDIDSAGTHPYHVGRSPDPRMHDAARRRGIDLSSMRARLVKPADFAQFTHVFAMDQANLRHLRTLRPATAVCEPELFLDLLGGSAPQDVPDPYYGGVQGFDRVLDLLDAGCTALMNRLVVQLDLTAGGEGSRNR